MQTNTSQGVIAWFVRNTVAANLLMLLILVAGISTLLNIRIEGFPQIPPNNVTIKVGYTSGSATSAEEGIAVKIEEALQGVEGIKTIQSLSDGEGVTVTVTRTSGYNLDLLYRDIKAKVDAISSLPKLAERPVISQEVALEGVMTINLFGDVADHILQSYAEDFRAKLLQDPDIQRVDYLGRKTPEITIEVDEAHLQAIGLSMSEIVSSINATSITTTGGELIGPEGKLILKTEQQRYNAKEFASIPVRQTRDGRWIRLADIATIKDDLAGEHHLTRYNGQNAIGLEVKMYGKANITHTATAVDRLVNTYRDTLPTGVEIEAWNDRSEPIKDRLALLLDNSVQGIAMVIALLALFLNARVAFWVAAGLPVIFAGAVTLMGDTLFGLTLNELTTFGFIIALGIVVDDAVVIGESIHHEREKHGATLQATISGARKVATPTTFGVLTTMVAFLSMSIIEGDLGKIFSQFAYAAAFCLLFSLIESKLILPAHLAHIKIKIGSGVSGSGSLWYRLQGQITAALNRFTYSLYQPFLRVVLKYRYAALALFVSVSISVVGLLLSGKIKSVFFPEISADFVTVELVFDDDAGYGLVQRETLSIEQLSDELNRQLTDEYHLTVDPIQHLLVVTSDNSATITAGLSANHQRPFTASTLAARWQAMLPPLEGVARVNFLADIITGKAISIELRSKNNPTIERAGQALIEELTRIQGVSGIKSGLKTAQAQVDLTLKPAGLAMGLTSSTLLEQIRLAYQGYEVQRLQQGQSEVKVKLQYPDEKRQSLGDLQYARIRLAGGQVVPLSTVAEISTKYVATSVERINQSRVNVISADVNKEVISPSEIMQSLNEGLFQQLKATYQDLDIVISGQHQDESEVTQSFQSAFMIAVMAIYMLLAIPLKSYCQPLIIMCAIPFGIVGALLGHWLHGIPISLLSMFGILALSGVVVNDSLLLLSCYNQERGTGATVLEALLASGTGRIRAILLTSTTTYAGLAPLLAETSPQAQFLIPAAISMGYGILFATLITLVLIPALVMVSEDLVNLTDRTTDAEAKNTMDFVQ
ncbi:TPA: efflux RND transporter permease subunit [Vibrio vulnificus]|uniref:efflux RND transporter permease subunit n=1 Tax=Vibrio vulnificus TaxID=672 RepID=UPI00102D0E69|nr:efflux RND transporter permease subunit [Vibrio vulnificus]RZR26810.1 efflux RND transporter permease subunit [Vibrio vulnificus]HAS8290891.1 efflux RND transporter permease subunit [Vibrio vulnificus]HAS8335021.1 efflux RND transporter permease subunit [Vibrio vulnificus]HAS8532295.1 efflux RND transporter permease subunit [Vibrio vulnificus]